MYRNSPSQFTSNRDDITGHDGANRTAVARHPLGTSEHPSFVMLWSSVAGA
jgi:hypothetical protein